jgi:hypothetical protein
MKKAVIILIAITLLGCNLSAQNTNIPCEIIGNDTICCNEYFIDSLNIGTPNHNKVELARYIGLDSVYVVIRFYAKSNNKQWLLKQQFTYGKDLIADCDTQIEDFNNDGFRDMTYVSDVGARSANEIRRLFIYDKNADELVYLKNSEDYPNMHYNKELNCIEAHLYYGCQAIVFLQIEGDSLKKIAEKEIRASEE